MGEMDEEIDELDPEEGVEWSEATDAAAALSEWTQQLAKVARATGGAARARAQEASTIRELEETALVWTQAAVAWEGTAQIMDAAVTERWNPGIATTIAVAYGAVALNAEEVAALWDAAAVAWDAMAANMGEVPRMELVSLICPTIISMPVEAHLGLLLGSLIT